MSRRFGAVVFLEQIQYNVGLSHWAQDPGNTEGLFTIIHVGEQLILKPIYITTQYHLKKDQSVENLRL